MKALVTAGPTREYLDSVRYLSNGSSGKTGIELARALKQSGFSVKLILGPGSETPKNIPTVRTVSALQMFEQVKRNFGWCDIFVSCAAVADYRPQKISRKKIKKGAGPLMVRLVPNPDILRTMGVRKGRKILVGFALEDAQGLQNARKKLKEKNCDMIVLNSPSTVEADKISASLLFSDGSALKLGKISKDAFAKKLCQTILKKFYGSI